MDIQVNTHINNWIDRAELDYYTMFIKTWIPYNAWYMHNFYDEDQSRTSDKDIINYIKNNSNKYRDKIRSLINGSSDNSKLFFNHLSILHYQLEQHPIPDYDNRLTFQTISIENNTSRSFNYIDPSSQYTYIANFDSSAPKTTKRWICEVIDNTNTTLHRIELFRWSISELREDNIYKNISNRDVIHNINNAFNEINPKKPTNIIVQPISITGGGTRKPNNSITIDEDKKLYFINDSLIIAKVIIQLMYELRCKLFHGELDPTRANQGIYEQAYYIHRMIINELR